MSPSSRRISASLTSSLEIGMESRMVGGEGNYHDADSSNTTSRLTRACLVGGVITLITLLFVRVADQDTLHGFGVHLPPLLLRHIRICDATKNPQVCQVWLLLVVQLMWRNSSICRRLILEVDGSSYRFGPKELRRMLLFKHCPCRLLYRSILPLGQNFGPKELLQKLDTGVFLGISYELGQNSYP